MLSVKPSSRPTILDILNKSFVRKRVASYISECLNSGASGETDVEDLNYDSLKEQGEKLGIFNSSGGVTGEEAQS